MAGSITKLLLASVAFAYGVFTVFLYFGIALADGTFFKRRTEKEKLELELGKYFKSLPPTTFAYRHRHPNHQERHINTVGLYSSGSLVESIQTLQ